LGVWGSKKRRQILPLNKADKQLKDNRTKSQEPRQEQMELATSREAGEQRRKLAYQFITKLKVYVIVDVYYTIEIDQYDLKSPVGGSRVKKTKTNFTLK
jgi:hypothetical protein